MNIEESRHVLHELNNVFTIILSSADLLLLDASIDSSQKADLENILSACDRGKKLIEELRNAPHA